MELLKLALVQIPLIWEKPVENRKNIKGRIDAIQDPVDIIVLPEMFTSGFTMNPERVAETMEGETVKWMKERAKEKQAAVCGSVVIEENGNYYNRFLFIRPDGTTESYDKRHTFTLAGEHEVYDRGQEKYIVTYKDWRICPLICYDLRFPVWARNTEDYDLLLYVANWPKPRVNAWDALLKARAIENMAYCIGVNRVGIDENGHEYSGHTAAYDVLGNTIAFSEKEETLIVTLEKNQIGKYRSKLKFLADQDSFSLQ
ncbi:amidohydrolase [Leptobacterium flavescens]|uniref:Omega-amidase YafV n=1 Tax=Leptobacterium flavescens TaxID=472055 RepID=A0A6P0UUI1_9FLAO|nr:amidohydrolase [Leptobacterium flavescens]NER14473.1 amidohydrolase [Leptobacterium flavescens]